MPKRQETRVFKQLEIRCTGQHFPSLSDISLAFCRLIADPRLLFGGICMIAIHQSGKILQATISGKCDFAVTRERLPICKTQVHEGRITRLEILLKKVTFFNSCTAVAMLLISDRLHENFRNYANNCSPPLFLPLTSPASS